MGESDFLCMFATFLICVYSFMMALWFRIFAIVLYAVAVTSLSFLSVVHSHFAQLNRGRERKVEKNVEMKITAKTDEIFVAVIVVVVNPFCKSCDTNLYKSGSHLIWMIILTFDWENTHTPIIRLIRVWGGGVNSIFHLFFCLLPT